MTEVKVTSTEGDRTMLVTDKVAERLIEQGWSAGKKQSGKGTKKAEPDDFDLATATVDEVLAWVGEDIDRAAEALEVEDAREDGPRKTLVEKLESLGQ